MKIKLEIEIDIKREDHYQWILMELDKLKKVVEALEDKNNDKRN